MPQPTYIQTLINTSSVLLAAFTSLWSEWWRTGVVRPAAGCRRGHGVGTGGERSPPACWCCAGSPASSSAIQERMHERKCERKSWQKMTKGRYKKIQKKGIQRERTPEQRWEARPETSEPWECPAGAREAFSSAGCWCSPAVVQPCSLSHPRPASCTEEKTMLLFNETHVTTHNHNAKVPFAFIKILCCIIVSQEGAEDLYLIQTWAST